jgi:hypothetical protein
MDADNRVENKQALDFQGSTGTVNVRPMHEGR